MNRCYVLFKSNENTTGSTDCILTHFAYLTNESININLDQLAQERMPIKLRYPSLAAYRKTSSRSTQMSNASSMSFDSVSYLIGSNKDNNWKTSRMYNTHVKESFELSCIIPSVPNKNELRVPDLNQSSGGIDS